MNKKGNKRKVVAINVDIDKWEHLGDYGVSNKSQWINDQIDRLMSITDDLQGLEMQLKEVEHKEKELAVEKAMILDKIERIKRMRGENANNTQIINEAMNILRGLADDNRIIAKYYVEYQVSHRHIEYKILESELRKENIKIKDIPIRTDRDTGEKAFGYLK